VKGSARGVQIGSDHGAPSKNVKKRPSAHSISPLAHLIALHKCYSAYALLLLLNYAVRSVRESRDERDFVNILKGAAHMLRAAASHALCQFHANEWAPCRTCGSQAYLVTNSDLLLAHSVEISMKIYKFVQGKITCYF
jgi:hypothetical protein